MGVTASVQDRLNALLAARGGPPLRAERVTGAGGGHDWSLHRARLGDGREVFVKAARGAHGALRAEREGLRWLAASGGGRGSAPGSGAPVPEVLAADDTMLVLPWIETGAPTRAAAERFGRELAALHARRPEAYGAPWPGFIADLPLDNGPGEDWPGWYAERRLVPYLRAGHGVLGADGVRLVERVIERVADLAGPPQAPSRIHGDLWSGNLLWSAEGRVMLIDPAAHGGHRETDLAMLALFGAPMLDRILAAYHEAAPPADGWRARIPLHQLHPLLVHVVLYGAGYRSSVMEAARRLLS